MRHARCCAVVVVLVLVFAQHSSGNSIKFKTAEGNEATEEDINLPPIHDCEVRSSLPRSLLDALTAPLYSLCNF